MAKELRLGFAMGGGVSLGAYSGAALTEAIKLAILRGDYERVVIDVFSGASAGAMSLLLMLRALAAPVGGEAARERAERNLLALYPDECRDIPRTSRKWQQLLAAQHAQDLQHAAWVEGVNIDLLLGGKQGVPADAPALLSSRAIEDLARRLVDFEDPLELNAAGLLAPRVAFACALTNLTAVMHDARISRLARGARGDRLALLDALTSNCHREVRVFDLWLDEGYDPEAEGEVMPGRWFRYRNGAQQTGRTGDLRERKAWSTMSATCLACGAFPFAFDPVVLRRREFEYGPALWKQFADRVPGARNADGHPGEIHMTYVDGGFLNNEPIREAFRLASMIDARHSDMPFERQIIFVDPRIAEEKPSLNVPVHTLYTDKDGKLSRRGSLARLIPHGLNLLAAFSNEASRNEADKIATTRNLFEQRDRARDVLLHALHPSEQDDGIGNSVFRELIAQCDAMLAGNKADVAFPPGTLTLEDEMLRVIREQQGDFLALEQDVARFRTDYVRLQNRALWLRVLSFVYLDLLMDVEGKQDRIIPIAIAPIEKDIDGRMKPDPLPGHEMAGFAGFTSLQSRQHQVAMARYHTERELRRHELIKPTVHDRARPYWQPDDQRRFIEEANTKLKRLEARVKDMVLRFLDVNFILKLPVKYFVGSLLDGAFAIKPARRRVEFRLKVPADCHIRLKGRNGPVRKPAALKGEDHLVICIDAEKDGANWRWRSVDDSEYQDTLTLFEGNWLAKRFCDIQMPTQAQIARLDDSAHPVFFAEITENDRGQVISHMAWETERFQPQGLEGILFPNLEREGAVEVEERVEAVA